MRKAANWFGLQEETSVSECFFGQHANIHRVSIALNAG
jgi:hypothetical protein